MLSFASSGRTFRRAALAAALAAATASGTALRTFGQGTEIEPNGTCATAQDLGHVDATTVISGVLDSAAAPDVDFFRFTATPNTTMVVDLEGQATDQGTLGDPYVGAFDARCALLGIDDDGGTDLNARLTVAVPADGVVVVAAAQCCDGAFAGGGTGTYALTLAPVQMAGSIGGRVVDADSGAPLPGDHPLYAGVELRRCTAGRCGEVVVRTNAASDGSFRIASDGFGNPLLTGTYQVLAFVGQPYRYQPVTTVPFAVGKGQDLDIGAIGLVPFPRAGSIGGRIVNARGGAPLPGAVDPFTRVELRLCDGGSCYNTVADQPTDADGRFRFERDYAGNALLATTYRIVVSARQFQAGESAEFAVAADAAHDLGDFALNPIPMAGSIRGRVVDAATGAVLRGDARPFARVELRACDAGGWCSAVATANTDAQGRFRFDRDGAGNPLEAREYRLAVTGDQYDSHETARLAVAEGQHKDVGDVLLRSHPLRFTEVRACGNLPLEGGDCAYSVRVTNGLSTTLEGGIWSLVGTQSDPWGGRRPLFQTGNPVSVRLTPGSSQVVQFQFHVPASAPNGQTICTEAVGGRAPQPYFDVIGRTDLFCITKGAQGFSVLSDKAANAVLHPRTDAARPSE